LPPPLPHCKTGKVAAEPEIVPELFDGYLGGAPAAFTGGR
jgi:hypothetical protein